MPLQQQPHSQEINIARPSGTSIVALFFWWALRLSSIKSEEGHSLCGVTPHHSFVEPINVPMANNSKSVTSPPSRSSGFIVVQKRRPCALMIRPKICRRDPSISGSSAFLDVEFQIQSPNRIEVGAMGVASRSRSVGAVLSASSPSFPT
jgi:hypothetical protein